MKRYVATLLLCTLAACGATAPVSHPDAGPDGGLSTDAGSRDTGSQDAGAQDAGTQDAGAQDAGPCLTDGSVGVTFELQHDGLLCLGDSCFEEWLTISDSNGTSVQFEPGVTLLPCTDCDQCEQSGCHYGYLGCPILPPSEGPATLVWNGVVYGSLMCSNGTACMGSSCAAPGTYTATMCLYAAADGSEECGPPPYPCKTLSFQWPPSPGADTVVWSQ